MPKKRGSRFITQLIKRRHTAPIRQSNKTEDDNRRLIEEAMKHEVPITKCPPGKARKASGRANYRNVCLGRLSGNV